LALSGCAFEGEDFRDEVGTIEQELTANGLAATISYSSDWGNGYCADVSLTNVGTTPISTWEVQIDLRQSTVSSSWSATTSVSAGRLIAKPLGWNANLAVGAKTSFGFCANAPSTSARPVVAAVTANGSGGGGGTGGTTGSGGATSTGGTTSTGGSSTGGSSGTGTCTATYEAENATKSTGYAISGGWNLNSAGTITLTHAFVAGSNAVTVSAKGDQANGAPRMRVSVAGTSLGEVDVPATSWANYSFTYSAPTAGSRTVEIAFTNDYYSGGLDRNLHVDKLSVQCGTTGGGGTTPAKKFVGNITTGGNHAVDTNGKVFSNHWDQITPENAGKWGSVQSTGSSAFNWAALDAIYDYAQSKGIAFKQHTFVWGAQQPSGTLTETHVRTWMRNFCQRYPKTALIDVVNEPPPHTTPSYANAIGGGTNSTWQWIINSFKWARESCPNAKLILNDYNNIEYADQNQHFINIAKAVKAAGAPIDAVGAQAHGLSGNISATTMKNLLTKMHTDTGLPVYITEYDIDLADDQAQLRKFQEHIPFFMDTQWIHGVTLWGWIHGATWIPNSGLIRNGQNRPAMNWLMDTLGRPRP
jgi:endo-1,4-beta-xylanase